VVHKYWRLNDSGKEQASNPADQSYASLAVDRDRGKVATRPDMAHALMRGVPEDRGQRDLHAVVIDYGRLAADPEARKNKFEPPLQQPGKENRNQDWRRRSRRVEASVETNNGKTRLKGLPDARSSLLVISYTPYKQ
jgi:hypothetical protein